MDAEPDESARQDRQERSEGVELPAHLDDVRSALGISPSPELAGGYRPDVPRRDAQRGYEALGHFAIGFSNVTGFDREAFLAEVDAVKLPCVANQGAVAMAADVVEDAARDGIGFFEARLASPKKPVEGFLVRAPNDLQHLLGRGHLGKTFPGTIR